MEFSRVENLAITLSSGFGQQISKSDHAEFKSPDTL
jgi:hypothetical protein